MDSSQMDDDKEHSAGQEFHDLSASNVSHATTMTATTSSEVDVPPKKIHLNQAFDELHREPPCKRSRRITLDAVAAVHSRNCQYQEDDKDVEIIYNNSDNSDLEAGNEDCCSEGGDDLHCTQIVIDLASLSDDDDEADKSGDDDDDDSDDSSSSSDDDQPLLSLVESPFETSQSAFSDVIENADDGAEETDDDQPLISLLQKPTAKIQEETLSNVSFSSARKSPQDKSVLAINLNDDKKREEGQQHREALPVVLQGPSSSATRDPMLMTCFVCGACLKHIQSGWNGRLCHIKRCSKRHGVQAKDLRLNDDYELFADYGGDNTERTSNGVNPYTSKPPSNWHGDAVVDLSIVASTEAARQQASNENDDKLPSVNSVLMAGARCMAQQHQPNSTSQSASKVPHADSTAPSVHSILMAGARRAAKIEKIRSRPKQNAGQKGKRGWGDRGKRIDYSQRACPAYKKIPGTDFVCDGFQYARKSLTQNYFLTHFHADHYGGIGRRWDAGTIYCSLGTANLVHRQLGVDHKYIHPLPMHTPVVVESRGKPVTVVLLDANHCPGAIMFLFQVGKRWILHVGDFRWNRAQMMEQSALRPFFTGEVRLDELFLDTTYCDPKYVLPTQDTAIQATIEKAVAEVESAKSTRQRLLMLFGAYTIGKERIYMSVAEQLGIKVYVDSRRYRILSALDWPKSTLSLFTTRPDETNLWVVPLGHISMKKLSSYLSVRIGSFGRDFDRVVGFRPTGWSMTAKGNGLVKTSSRGKLTVHSVPYSEHSSFTELVDCIACLRPKRIIPTVSVSKSKQQVELLLENLGTVN